MSEFENKCTYCNSTNIKLVERKKGFDKIGVYKCNGCKNMFIGIILVPNKKALRRVYIYEKDYQKISTYAKIAKLDDECPNHKANFPYYLEVYINLPKEEK